MVVMDRGRWTCPFCHKSQSVEAYHQCIASNVDCRQEWYRRTFTPKDTTMPLPNDHPQRRHKDRPVGAMTSTHRDGTQDILGHTWQPMTPPERRTVTPLRRALVVGLLVLVSAFAVGVLARLLALLLGA